MPTLYVVRHGHVDPNSTDAQDPELSVAGRSQAARVADELHARLPAPVPILTSPLLRCRETAAPLCALWRVEPVVEPRVAEVPGPPPSALSREDWLRRALFAEWPELISLGRTLVAGYDTFLRGWRAGVLEAALACPNDAVIFSHFVPVNVLTGHATGSERVACFQPDHTSITVFETEGGGIRLIERGRERINRVV